MGFTRSFTPWHRTDVPFTTRKTGKTVPDRHPDARRVVCPQCGARIGKPCRSPRGSKNSHSHIIRAAKATQCPPDKLTTPALS